MYDLEEKLVKLCDGIRALVEWEAELRQSGENGRAREVWDHLVQMVEFAARMPAATGNGLTAKRHSLSAVVAAQHGADDHAAVLALRVSIERDRRRFGVDGDRLLH